MKQVRIVSLFLMLWACCASAAYGQWDAGRLFAKGPFREITTDPLGRVLAVAENGAVHQYDLEGKLRRDFSDPWLGMPSQVDAYDPFKKLVFYRDLGLLLFLDREFGELERINLMDLNLPQVAAAGFSVDNQIWVYDLLNRILKKIDRSGRSIVESPPLDRFKIRGQEVLAVYERHQRVFVITANQGIIVFDSFGKLVKGPSDKPVTNWFFGPNTIYAFFSETGWQRYVFSSDEFEPIDFSFPERGDHENGRYALLGETLFVLGADGDIWSYQLATAE